MDVLHQFFDPMLNTRNYEGNEDTEPEIPPSEIVHPSVQLSSTVSKEEFQNKPFLLIGLRGSGSIFVHSLALNSSPASSFFIKAIISSSKSTTNKSILANLLDKNISALDTSLPIAVLCTSTLFPTVCVCLCQNLVLPEESKEFTSLLFSTLKQQQQQQVFVFGSLSAVFYRSTNNERISPPLLRSIFTTNFKKELLNSSQQQPQQIIKPLESPNLIDGIFASILTHCEFDDKNYKCVGFISLIEPRIIEPVSVHSYLDAISLLPEPFNQHFPSKNQLSQQLSHLNWNRQSSLFA